MGRGRWIAAAAAAMGLVGALPAAASADVLTAGGLALEKVGDFSSPVFVAVAPGDDRRLFVVEQPGRIMVVRDGQKLNDPFIDLTEPVLSGGERGLLGMAFSPDYATSGRFYVYYTADEPQGEIRIEEYRRSTGSEDRADPGTRRVVLTQAHAEFGNHNGGPLAFGPDGYLYAGLGDGGSGGDPRDNGQTLTTLLGKLLRIDPRPTATGPYAIPPGNMGAPARPEILHYGLRNPWRFSFDRVRGDLLLGDVGQNMREEVDFLPLGRAAGANFGWDRCEGDLAYPGPGPCQPPQGYVAPSLVYSTQAQGNCAVTGGYVVRDRGVPSLVGRYLYADYCQGDLRSAVVGAGSAQGDAPTGLNVSNLSSFGEDNQCRLYVTSTSGPVYRLRQQTPPAESGCPGDARQPAMPPPPGDGAEDRTAPSLRVRVRAVQRSVRSRRVSLTVRCDEACRLTATGRVSGAVRRRLAGSRRTLRANAGLRVRVRLSRATTRAVRRALARRHRVVATVRLEARDATGNVRTATRRVLIAR